MTNKLSLRDMKNAIKYGEQFINDKECVKDINVLHEADLKIIIIRLKEAIVAKDEKAIEEGWKEYYRISKLIEEDLIQKTIDEINRQ